MFPKMPNDQSPTTQRRRRILGGAMLFSLLWWAAGWVMTPTIWWGVVFSVSLIVVMGLIWWNMRGVSSDDTDQTEPDQGLSPDVQRMLQAAQPPASTSGPGPMSGMLPSLIRVFASIDDGQRHGWEFGEQTGTFDGAPVYNWAEHNDSRWSFDGLAPLGVQPIVPEDVRLFGRLRYKRFNPPVAPEALAS